MRTRLVAVFTTLVVLVIAGLAVPLGGAYASHRTGRLLLDRRADATRFAELADLAARTGDRESLQPEISRYAALYGASVWIGDRDGVMVARAGGGLVPDHRAIELALSGRTTDALPSLTPFGPQHVLIAEPSGRDAQISGAVLLLAPTAHARTDIAWVWAALLLAGLVVLAFAVLVARVLAWWILRPVTELDDATQCIAEGKLGTRTTARLGPPELRRLEQRFNDMVEAVAAAMARYRDFAFDVSHELRNPLAALMFRLENLRPYLAPAGGPEFEETADELNRLARIVTDLLRLARAEGRAPIASELDIVAELAPMLEAWREVFDALEVGFSVRLPPLLRVRAVPGSAARIAEIVLDNAHKFVPSGGSVTVTLDADDLVLRIADTGPGLSEEDRAKALERYWRAPDHADLPGSGLGLSIAAAEAASCGARLTLLPNHPRGLVVETRFQPWQAPGG
ncbi:sensor histidine kinase [Actinomadura rupiterrae]|uniref:sensor histidine kinase n=1 Tax=Actinomadura rupiterrae TaxID=559627 RepID=UPI0020A447C6|nr:HAMP domain-containing sensor histidine kinase [Actinomadura rupiterrae]MCP2342306.1 signal transduction histidine kinase [Actinomadura rupiterrae]